MPDDSSDTPRGGWQQRRRLLGGLAAALVIGAVFIFVLPRIADYRDVWAVLKTLGWRDAVLLTVATMLNLATFAPPWMAALPGISYRQALAMSQASTALSIVSPAGAAVGMAASYSMLRSWGFVGSAVGLAVALTGAWNQLANLAFPVIGFAMLTSVDEDHPALRTAALIGLAVLVVVVTAFALVLSRERHASRIGDVAARFLGWVYRFMRLTRTVEWGGAGLAAFRGRALELLRRRWHVLTIATLVGHLTVFLVLLACLRAVEITSSEVSWIEAFAAWSLVRILGALPLTPGGLGIVELGLTGALVAFGASNADALAATLLYRFLTVVPTLVLGMLAAATWRTHHPEQRAERGSDHR